MVEKKVEKKVVKKSPKKVAGKKLAKPKYSCCNCGKEVHELDKQVLLTTADKGKITEEIVFHFECWQEYFNKAVTKKAKQNVASVQKKVMGLMDN